MDLMLIGNVPIDLTVAATAGLLKMLPTATLNCGPGYLMYFCCAHECL